MKTLLDNLSNLLKVKTIITLVMVIGATLFLAYRIDLPDWYIALVSSVVTFYFSRKGDGDVTKTL